VRGTKTIKTRKGDLMAFVTIEDLNGAVEVTVFSRLYATAADLLVEDRALLVHGQVQRDEQSVKMTAESIIPLEKAEERWTASVHVNLDLERADRETLTRVREVLQRHPGRCRAFLHLRSPRRADAVIALPEGLCVKAGPGLRRELGELVGYGALETRCTGVDVPPPPKPHRFPRFQRMSS
jgi:DNA polymerase-3 subunit alpha